MTRYSFSVVTYDLADAAERGGVDAESLEELVALGILTPDGSNRFTSGDVRRAGLVMGLTAAGISLDGLGEAIRSGKVSLAFLDAPAFDRFSTLSESTFAEMAERTGVPVEMLTFIREAGGSVAPDPGDRLRDVELPFVAMIEGQLAAGFRPSVIQQLIRAQCDGLRRVAETESNMWVSELIQPAMARGVRPDEILGDEFGDRMSALTEQCVIAMYHMQQTQAWTVNLIDGVEAQLAAAGLHSRLAHPPAMCFLDITGYTRLTQEHGDAAAAELAEHLDRVVHRSSIKYGGRAVKWLGDGVMLHFPIAGAGVSSALEMVAGVAAAGLPPAHVGLHAGPVIFQEGDYYGQTVNVASRIADYARPGEVIVSQAVVDASAEAALTFREIGPVELKGVSGVMHLYAAAAPG